MSTRSVIARVGEHEGQFAGRYVHSDGMPTSMGECLWNLLHGHFKNDLQKMLAYLIDANHALCGWSSVVGKDFSLRPAYTCSKAIADGASYEIYSKRDDYRRPQCFAGRKGEEPYLYTEKDLEGTDVEWLYVFDETERKLFVRDVSAKEDVAVIDLDGEQPNWTVIECGENFERCGHYGWVHFPELKGMNIGTQTFLGNEPFKLHDAIGFIIDGKRVKNTGSGYSHLSRYRKVPVITHPVPPECSVWIQTIQFANGRRADVPVAVRGPQGEQPYPGVQWIFPPTLKNPKETVR